MISYCIILYICNIYDMIMLQISVPFQVAKVIPVMWPYVAFLTNF